MEMIDLLEEDKEKLEQSLVRSGTPQEAQDVLQGELDRMLLRYNETCSEDLVREAAASITQTARTAVQVIDSTGEVRVWNRNEETGAPAGKKVSKWALITMIAGFVLTGGAVIGSAVAAGGGAAVIFKALPAVLCGSGLMYFSGRFSSGTDGDKAASKGAAGTGGSAGSGAAVRTEVLVDPGKVMNCMRAVAMVMDRNLKAAEQALAVERARLTDTETAEEGLPRDESALLSEVLELSYGQLAEDPGAEGPGEVISTVRFYLHQKQIDIVDYDETNRAWFELLPGNGPAKSVTLRPALVRDGVLVRKGLAAVGAQ